MLTGQLQISASLHGRYQNADQHKPAELNQERVNFIPKRDVMQMLNVDPNLCRADVQAYILVMETV